MLVAVKLKDESGITLVELMVGLAVGMVVMAALSMVLITTIRTTARVGARVDATQRARIVLGQVTEQLHSACFKPQVAPILPDSNATRLSFAGPTSATVAAVSPTPQKNVISYANGNLEQATYTWISGPPEWKFSEPTPASTRKLLTKVGPTTSGAIFRYFKFVEGALKEVEPRLVGSTFQIGTEASSVVEVQVALNAAPSTTPVADAGADTSVQDGAVLRLTPPTFPQASTALPCS
jgi:Tfp pilus assembly protein PilW